MLPTFLRQIAFPDPINFWGMRVLPKIKSTREYVPAPKRAVDRLPRDGNYVRAIARDAIEHERIRCKSMHRESCPIRCQFLQLYLYYALEKSPDKVVKIMRTAPGNLQDWRLFVRRGHVLGVKAVFRAFGKDALCKLLRPTPISISLECLKFLHDVVKVSDNDMKEIVCRLKFDTPTSLEWCLQTFNLRTDDACLTYISTMHVITRSGKIWTSLSRKLN